MNLFLEIRREDICKDIKIKTRQILLLSHITHL